MHDTLCLGLGDLSSPTKMVVIFQASVRATACKSVPALLCRLQHFLFDRGAFNLMWRGKFHRVDDRTVAK